MFRLLYPASLRCCAENAGVEGEVIVQKLLGQPFEVGYNAMHDRVEDLITAGVLDPSKVTRSGLTNACSIAGIMLTTQVGTLRCAGACWAVMRLLHLAARGMGSS